MQFSRSKKRGSAIFSNVSKRVQLQLYSHICWSIHYHLSIISWWPNKLPTQHWGHCLLCLWKGVQQITNYKQHNAEPVRHFEIIPLCRSHKATITFPHIAIGSRNVEAYFGFFLSSCSIFASVLVACAPGAHSHSQANSWFQFFFLHDIPSTQSCAVAAPLCLAYGKKRILSGVISTNVVPQKKIRSSRPWRGSKTRVYSHFDDGFCSYEEIRR